MKQGPLHTFEQRSCNDVRATSATVAVAIGVNAAAVAQLKDWGLLKGRTP